MRSRSAARTASSSPLSTGTGVSRSPAAIRRVASIRTVTARRIIPARESASVSEMSSAKSNRAISSGTSSGLTNMRRAVNTASPKAKSTPTLVLKAILRRIVLRPTRGPAVSAHVPTIRASTALPRSAPIVARGWRPGGW